LGGYSIGGLIAYEMANLLIQKGHSVLLLILIDTVSPNYPGKKIPEDIYFIKLKITFNIQLKQLKLQYNRFNKKKNS